MILGAQLYTVRNFTKTEEDIKKTLKRIADIGYTTLHVSGIGSIAPEKLREIADQNGLEIVITHTKRDRILNETAEVIREHQIMGCKHIGIGNMGFIPQEAAAYHQLIKDYDSAAKQIYDSRMKLHYHNHAYEFEKFGDRTGYDILMQETDPQLWGFIVDTYWIQVGGKDPADMITALAGRIHALHLKDLTIKNNKPCMTEVMAGNLDWQKIIKACEDTNVPYAFVEHDDDWTVGPFESLETSYRNLTRAFPALK